MQVTVSVVGGDTHELDVAADATYGDLLAPLAYTSHEVSVLVDGRPVPEDAPVASDRVDVVRLVKGG